MKRTLSLLLCLLLLIAMTSCSGGSQAPASSATPSSAAASVSSSSQPAAPVSKTAVSIATAGMGGAYYPVGVGLSEIFTNYVPEVEARVEVTGGTVENPGLVDLGDAEIGLANKDMAYFAFEGAEPFNQKHENLRGLFNGLAPGVVHYAVLESSGIKTLSDLKGKKVAVGPQGNSTSLFLRKALETLGYFWGDITPSYLSFSEGMQALSDGKVDMAIASAGTPVSAIQELAATGKSFRLLGLEDEFRAKFLEAYPYYMAYTIPKDVYNLPEDVVTVATQNMVMVNADVSEELVYKMTKAIFENLDILIAASPSASYVTLEDAPNTNIPLHPGAERYFKEVGALK